MTPAGYTLAGYLVVSYLVSIVGNIAIHRIVDRLSPKKATLIWFAVIGLTAPLIFLLLDYTFPRLK